MADAVSRVTSGQNASASSPCSTAPARRTPSAAWPRPTATRCRSSCCPAATRAASPTSRPNFNSLLNYRTSPSGASRSSWRDAVPDAMRRAFTQVKNGRPAPGAGRDSRSTSTRRRSPEPLDYKPAPRTRSAPTRTRSTRPRASWSRRERPVIYAGQGVHYARGLGAAARAGRAARGAGHHQPRGQERLPGEPPAVARLGRPLDAEAGPRVPARTRTSSSASAAASRPPTTASRCRRARPSSTPRSTRPTSTRTSWPSYALIGDAGLTLDALLAAVRDRLKGKPRGRRTAVAAEIATMKAEWLAQWMPKLTSNDTPLSPYRVIWDLLHTVDVANTIITHDAGSPRDQLSPFWESHARRSPTSAGARPPSSATAWASRWAPSSRSRTSSASTSGATRRSASPAWTSRPRCASASRSCRSCSTTSRWRSSCRS